MQSDAFNRSRIRTVVAIVLTSDLRLVAAPGNVLVPAHASGLPRDSCANVSQIVALDREFLETRAGRVGSRIMARIDAGVELVLELS